MEYLKNGLKAKLRADREIILSGGSINSPQLLQLSGIGEPDHLKSLGIKVEAPLAGVGQNLQDHLAVGVQTCCTQPISLLPYVKPVKAALALARYNWDTGGPGAYYGIEAMAFVDSGPDLVAPDIQYHFEMIMYRDHGREIIPEHGCAYENAARRSAQVTMEKVAGVVQDQPPSPRCRIGPAAQLNVTWSDRSRSECRSAGHRPGR